MYVNPYEAIRSEKGEWLKANFHVHAWPGRRGYEVDDVVYMYKEADYDVLTISSQRSFVDTREHGSRHGILTINGIEYIEQDGILCIGIREFIRGDPQEAIEDCNRQGGFAVLCHPNWQSEEGMPPALPRETLRTLRGYAGIEILTPGIFDRFKGSGLATDVWDELLSGGKLVWGFANDDFHRMFNFDRAWTVLYAGARNYESIREAVKRGSLYASTGLTLSRLSLEGSTISVAANHVGSPFRNIRYQFIGSGGRLLAESTGDTAEYRMQGHEPYVRVQAASEAGAMLWTQPVYNPQMLRPLG